LEDVGRFLALQATFCFRKQTHTTNSSHDVEVKKTIEIEKDQTSIVPPFDPKSWAEWFEKNPVSEDFMVADAQPTEQIRDNFEVQSDQSD
jgi:hypothetical protein